MEDERDDGDDDELDDEEEQEERERLAREDGAARDGRGAEREERAVFALALPEAADREHGGERERQPDRAGRDALGGLGACRVAERREDRDEHGEVARRGRDLARAELDAEVLAGDDERGAHERDSHLERGL